MASFRGMTPEADLWPPHAHAHIHTATYLPKNTHTFPKWKVFAPSFVLYLCVRVFSLMSVPHAAAWCPQRPEKASDPLGLSQLRVARWALGLNLGPLEEQPRNHYTPKMGHLDCRTIAPTPYLWFYFLWLYLAMPNYSVRILNGKFQK